MNAMSEAEIKDDLRQLGVDSDGLEAKSDLVAALLNARAEQRPMFDTANIDPSQFGKRGTQW